MASTSQAESHSDHIVFEDIPLMLANAQIESLTAKCALNCAGSISANRLECVGVSGHVDSFYKDVLHKLIQAGLTVDTSTSLGHRQYFMIDIFPKEGSKQWKKYIDLLLAKKSVGAVRIQDSTTRLSIIPCKLMSRLVGKADDCKALLKTNRHKVENGEACYGILIMDKPGRSMRRHAESFCQPSVSGIGQNNSKEASLHQCSNITSKPASNEETRNKLYQSLKTVKQSIQLLNLQSSFVLFTHLQREIETELELEDYWEKSIFNNSGVQPKEDCDSNESFARKSEDSDKLENVPSTSLAISPTCKDLRKSQPQNAEMSYTSSTKPVTISRVVKVKNKHFDQIDQVCLSKLQAHEKEIIEHREVKMKSCTAHDSGGGHTNFKLKNFSVVVCEGDQTKIKQENDERELPDLISETDPQNLDNKDNGHLNDSSQSELDQKSHIQSPESVLPSCSQKTDRKSNVNNLNIVQTASLLLKNMAAKGGCRGQRENTTSSEVSSSVSEYNFKEWLDQPQRSSCETSDESEARPSIGHQETVSNDVKIESESDIDEAEKDDHSNNTDEVVDSDDHWFDIYESGSEGESKYHGNHNPKPRSRSSSSSANFYRKFSQSRKRKRTRSSSVSTASSKSRGYPRGRRPHTPLLVRVKCQRKATSADARNESESESERNDEPCSSSSHKRHHKYRKRYDWSSRELTTAKRSSSERSMQNFKEKSRRNASPMSPERRPHFKSSHGDRDSQNSIPLDSADFLIDLPIEQYLNEVLKIIHMLQRYLIRMGAAGVKKKKMLIISSLNATERWMTRMHSDTHSHSNGSAADTLVWLCAARKLLKVILDFALGNLKLHEHRTHKRLSWHKSTLRIELSLLENLRNLQLPIIELEELITAVHRFCLNGLKLMERRH